MEEVRAGQSGIVLPTHRCKLQYTQILLEVAIATIFTLYTILAYTGRFKPIKQFNQSVSYDSSFYKPNFKNYKASRADLLLPYLK